MQHIFQGLHCWIEACGERQPFKSNSLTSILRFASREHWKDSAHWGQTMTKAIDLRKIVKAIKRKANFKLGDSMS
jgi:hypothetical protein